MYSISCQERHSYEDVDAMQQFRNGDYVMKSNTKYYTHEHFHTDLKEALYVLQYDIVWDIFVYILEHKKVPVDDIYYIPPPPSCPDPINLLIHAGLIIRKTTDITNINKCYYTPTKTGEMLMDALIDVYLPKIELV